MAVIYGPNIVLDGLVCCLDDNDPKSYNGSCNTLTDVVGGYNAGLYNSPTHTQPVAGLSKAITLDGVNDYIYNTNLPGGDSSFTIDIWVYHNGTDQGSSYGIYSGGNSSKPLFYAHNTQMGSGHYFPDNISGTDYFNNYSSTTNQTWVHYVHTYANITVDNTSNVHKGYKNGALGGTNTTNFNNSGHGGGGNGFALGTYSSGSTNTYYKGCFGSFRYYNKTLSDAEVKQNFEAHRKRYGV